MYTHGATSALRDVHGRADPGARLGKAQTCASKGGAAEVLAMLRSRNAAPAVSAFDEGPVRE
jgi:hypothetical protein